MLKTNNYSIGVVTYINRYHTYFKQNVLNLLKYFPDKQIIIVINGHPDKLNNIAYLKEITQWLSSLNVQYVTFEDHQSLAKCWNWILLMSSAQNNLFLNDDILIKKNFRPDFENHLSKKQDFFTINNSFSHFFLSKTTIKEVGWFDERFLGIGQEDGDYLIRMAQKNKPLNNLKCTDIINYVAPGTNPSFQEISPSAGKYSSVNKEFMNNKWFFNHLTTENFIPDIKFTWNNEEYLARLRNNMETPVFYDYSLLDDNHSFAPRTRKIKNILSDVKEITRNILNKFRL
jgi:hypothetical protein